MCIVSLLYFTYYRFVVTFVDAAGARWSAHASTEEEENDDDDENLTSRFEWTALTIEELE